MKHCIHLTCDALWTLFEHKMEQCLLFTWEDITFCGVLCFCDGDLFQVPGTPWLTTIIMTYSDLSQLTQPNGLHFKCICLRVK